MSPRDFLGYLVVLTMVLNVADRLLSRRPGLLHFPGSGGMRQFLSAWSILMAALAALCLFGAVPVLWFLVAGAGWMAFSQGYSIFFRHARRRTEP